MIVELVINVYRLSRLFALELTYTLLFIGIINGVLLIGAAVYFLALFGMLSFLKRQQLA